MNLQVTIKPLQLSYETKGKLETPLAGKYISESIYITRAEYAQPFNGKVILTVDKEETPAAVKQFVSEQLIPLEQAEAVKQYFFPERAKQDFILPGKEDNTAQLPNKDPTLP